MFELCVAGLRWSCCFAVRCVNPFNLSLLTCPQLTNKSTALAEEITALEEELREGAVRSGELSVTATAQPNGVCVQLGALCLVLVESTWGWLGRDDQLLFPMVTEIEIHEQVRRTHHTRPVMVEGRRFVHSA